MKTLHKFVIKSYIGPLVLTFFIVQFILLMQFLWKYIDDLAGKGLEWNIIAELLLYASSSLVPMALPLAILMASLMTFGNLGENYELSAMKSSGISLQMIMSPLIALTIVICFLAFLFSNYVLPFSNLKMRSLLYDVRHQPLELQIKEGIFYNGLEGYSIKVEEKNRKTNLLKGIMIYDHTGKTGNTKITLADSGYMNMTSNKQHLMITLFNGYTYEELQSTKRKARSQKTYPHRRDEFEKQQFFISLDGFEFERTNEALFKSHYQMLNLEQLEASIDSMSGLYEDRLERFNKMIATSNLYRQERKYPSKAEVKTDSIPVNFDLDSIFNSLTMADKKLVIRQALVYARGTKRHITTSKTELVNRKKVISKYNVEWHRKFTLSFACFIFFFIGAPLGAIIRKGGLGMPAVISVIFFLFYYMLSISGEKFVKEGITSAFSGMWVSSFVLFPLGIFLTYKATTDSSIMNFETYSNVYRKFFRKQLMSHYYPIVKKQVPPQEIPDEKYLLPMRSLIFNAKKCMLEADNLYSNLVRSYNLHLKTNIKFVEFSKSYNKMFKMLLDSRFFEIDYFKNRMLELPFFDLSRMKHQDRNLFLSLLIIVLFPAKIIQAIIGVVSIQLLKNRFAEIIGILQDLIYIIEDPIPYNEFLEKK